VFHVGAKRWVTNGTDNSFIKNRSKTRFSVLNVSENFDNSVGSHVKDS